MKAFSVLSKNAEKLPSTSKVSPDISNLQKICIKSVFFCIIITHFCGHFFLLQISARGKVMTNCKSVWSILSIYPNWSIKQTLVLQMNQLCNGVTRTINYTYICMYANANKQVGEIKMCRTLSFLNNQSNCIVAKYTFFTFSFPNQRIDL